MNGLYVIAIDALPSPGSEAAHSFGGAYINVYTTDHSESAALATAAREVTRAGWQSRKIEKISYVTRADFEDDSDGLAYYNQALLDGIVLVVHTFPNRSDDDDVVH